MLDMRGSQHYLAQLWEEGLLQAKLQLSMTARFQRIMQMDAQRP